MASFGGLAGLSRYMRGSLLEVIRQDYMRTARAKGLAERVVIYKHGVRNAVIPVVTLLGLMLPGLLGGSVIIETVFAIPGMGQLFYQSAFSRDEPVLMALIVIGASLSLFGNIVADVSYALVDPRIRFRESGGAEVAGRMVQQAGRTLPRESMFWRQFRKNRLALAGGVVVSCWGSWRSWRRCWPRTIRPPTT